MTLPKNFLLVFLVFITFSVFSQDAVTYKLPPKEITDMIRARPTPNITINDKGEWILFSSTDGYRPVEDIARPELRIAGLRINPSNFSPSRQNPVTSLYLKQVSSGKEFKIEGLPQPLAAGNFSWSPKEKKIAFTNTSTSRVDLYVIDLSTRKAAKINKTPLNPLLVRYQWYDENTIIYPAIIKPASAAPSKPLVPKGPAVQENYGKASPRPTFQDMIKTPYDEELFAFYTTTQLVKNVNGVESKIGKPGIYDMVSISPDKKYILLKVIHRPFSYLVPAQGFPSKMLITDVNGQLVKELADLPSTETAPGGNDNVMFMPRAFEWRDDEPATIVWCMPLDSGLIKKDVEYHDAVFALTAPFKGKATEIFRTKMRYGGVTWGNKEFALVTEGLRGKQITQLDRYNPVTGDLEKIFSRNTTDAYSNPGQPVTQKNEYDKYVIKPIDKGRRILMNNQTGSSPDGDLPFLATFDLVKKQSHIIWRSQPGFFEYVAYVLDPEQLKLLTRRESEKEMPNYWIKNLKLREGDRQLTFFSNPYPQMNGVTKEKIKYKRADGVDLTGDLYLPKGYDKNRDGKLPVIVWAYPIEYNSAADAAQVRGSEHRFTLINYGSPVFYVTQGYAVFNNAEMPIVAASKEKKPNDNFVDQLRMNAEAAIHVLDSLGVADKNRVAVGGHSYGAFMTANLLAHTDLFKAGIARSGAYNRTLTPFGFQNEDRNYWEAPQLYHTMSPFSYADKIKEPLLLIHGEMDNNTGTYPIQSERMFNALKGHGGTAKYVSLPFESHGYAGRENILHMLAEQYEWLEKYVKNIDRQKAF